MNPVQRLFEAGKKSPETDAIASAKMNVPYKDLVDQTQRFAAVLKTIGIKKGSVVGVDTLAEIEIPIIFALLQLGAISFKSNEEILKSYKDKIDFVLISGKLLEIPEIKTIKLDGEFLRQVQRTNRNYDIEKLSKDDLVRIVFSSGSTGVPKGIPFSVRMMGARIQSANENWMAAKPFFCHLGLATVSGFQTMMWHILSGETYIHGSGHESEVLLHNKLKVKAIKTSPAKLKGFLDYLEKTQSELPDLEVVQVAGGILSLETATRCKTKLGIIPTYLYGSTEVGTVSRGFYDFENPAKVGRIIYSKLFKVVDEKGKFLPAGQEGRVAFKLKKLVSQYWNGQPSASVGFIDGWFFPGDHGLVTQNGELILSGREDDVINFGGVKYNLMEIDLVLGAVPQIEDVACFKVTKFGQDPVLVITFVSNTQSHVNSITDLLKSKYRHFGRVKLLRVPIIPRNELGKVSRAKLKALYEKQV